MSVEQVQVDEHGQVVECVKCTRLKDEIVGLQRDIRGWAARYAELQRDKEAEAEEHPRYEEAKELFGRWKDVCKHRRSHFTAERFFAVLPHLEKHGYDLCKRAIDGAAYDAFETKRRNGSTKRFDEWERVFGDSKNFEDFANRAPRNVK